MVIIGDLVIDAAEAETHRHVNTITSHPIESGADVTDHVVRAPEMLAVSGIVSDSPLEAVRSLRAAGVVPSEEAEAELVRLRRTAEIVPVETARRTYPSMVLESLEWTERGDTGKAYRFTATFKEIRIIDNERVSVPVSIPQAKAKSRKGHKPSPKVDKVSPKTETKRKSILTNIVDRFR